MSVAGDIFKTFQDVVLIKANVERLEQNATKMSHDISQLADGLSAVNSRVASLEGYIRGRSDQAALTPFLSKD